MGLLGSPAYAGSLPITSLEVISTFIFPTGNSTANLPLVILSPDCPGPSVLVKRILPSLSGVPSRVTSPLTLPTAGPRLQADSAPSRTISDDETRNRQSRIMLGFRDQVVSKS